MREVSCRSASRNASACVSRSNSRRSPLIASNCCASLVASSGSVASINSTARPASPRRPAAFDARGEAEDDVADGARGEVDPGHVGELLEAEPGPRAQPLQPLGHQHPVLAVERDEVAGRGDGDEVEPVHRRLGIGAETSERGLDELEPDPAAAELLERVGAVGPLRVQHGRGVGEDVRGLVVVADDEVEPLLFRVLGLLAGGDAAVERDDQARPDVRRLVDADPSEARSRPRTGSG